MFSELSVLFIGGSNTLLGGGYVSAVMDSAENIYGKKVSNFLNMAVGGNNSLHGLEIVKTMGEKIREFNTIFIEYMVNDIRSGPAFETWSAGYEGIVRYLLSVHKDVKIVSLLFCPRMDPLEERKRLLFSRVEEISARYGTGCIDVDRYLRRVIRAPEGKPALDFDAEVYLDSAHYRRPVVTSLIGSYIAHQVFGLGNDGSGAALQRPVSDYTFENISLFDFSAVEGAGVEIVDFKNSKFHHPSLKISAEHPVTLTVPGGLLALTYISHADSGALLIKEEGQRPFYIDTLHQGVKKGDYRFLIRSFLFGWKDWSEPSLRGPREIQLSLLPRQERRNYKLVSRMHMQPEAVAFDKSAAYVSLALCVDSIG